MSFKKIIPISLLCLSTTFVLSSCVKNKRGSFKTIELGYYPQNVCYNYLNEILDKKIPDDNDLVYYEGITYKKQMCNAYSDESNYYTTKLPVKLGEYTYFELNPIKWRILEKTEDYYLVTTKDILFCESFNKVDYSSHDPNDYEYSYIRNYLNDYIYNEILGADECLMQIEVNNDFEIRRGTDTESKTYYDYVTLLSPDDFTKKNGFKREEDKYAFACDYLIAQGIKTYQESPNSFYFASCEYFTRSKVTIYYDTNEEVIPKTEAVYSVDMLGLIGHKSVYEEIGIRPVIKLDRKLYDEKYSK